MDEESIELGRYRNKDDDNRSTLSRKGTIYRSSINQNSLVR